MEDYLSDWDSQGILPKVFGGHDADHGSIPWQANLMLNEEQFCGGTILSEYWVLTAAHCYNKYANYKVVVGDIDQLKDEDEDEKFKVEKFIKHKDYFLNISDGNVVKIINDIALIKIKPKYGRGFQFNDYIQPACLPDSDAKPEPHQKYIASGWGYTSPTGMFPI
ncbi:coagulation factor X-like [Physella acuta]|uniref:coagulation factor X-like n=1 Tax=Physella acuta TaxID=109671 RepID=UPI0027DDB666|nr:coagulation factor X-like [Physella acuta]